MYSDSEDEDVPQFPKLKGDENAFEWFRHMKYFLVCRALWHCVDPDSPTTAQEAETQKVDGEGKKIRTLAASDQYRARYCIMKGCENSVLLTYLREVRTGREAYSKLLQQFHNKAWSYRYRVYRKFLKAQMQPRESLTSWAHRLRQIAAEYEWRGGNTIEEIQIITKFIEDLAPEYTFLRPSVHFSYIVMLKDNEDPKLEKCLNVMKTFLSVEERRNLWARDRSDSTSNPRPKFPPKNPEHKYYVCQKCAKIGHIAFHCRSEVEGFATAKKISMAQRRADKMKEKILGS